MSSRKENKIKKLVLKKDDSRDGISIFMKPNQYLGP